MSEGTYKADIEDMRFVLFDQHRMQDKLAHVEAFEDYDRETYGSILEEGQRIAEEVLSPVNQVGDEQGVKLDAKGNVTTPDCFNGAWDAMAEGGWIGVAAPTEFGGSGLPYSIAICTTEMFSAAATAFYMYAGLTAAASRVIMEFAPDHLSHLVAEKCFTGEWGGTMCLTEAGAGSDVGANRAKAERTDEEGVYLLEGEKIFISGGDHDLAGNLVHLVLARTPDAPAGTRGLSIFLVSKFHFDAEGELGERNSAFVRGIEHKMGINGSATCTLVLGDEGPCTGHLIGKEGQGMAIMFHMMNEARVGVGNQGLSLAAHAYRNCLDYARERKQGSSIDQFKNADAPRVAITMHPDVRRMLLWQKAHVETMRSLVYRMGVLADLEDHGADAATKKSASRRIDLLVPIVKSHCTDIGFECTVQAIQVMGGYGYIREYPVEQHCRDAKIGSVYEGTNGIQAMDLIGRKLRIDGGALLMEWIADAMGACARGKEAGFAVEAGALEKSINQLGATAMHLGALGAGGKLEQTMLHAVPFQRMFGTVLLGVEAMEQALVAKAMIDADGETPHLAGKALNLRFYTHNVLPLATAMGKGIQSDDGAALDERLFG